MPAPRRQGDGYKGLASGYNSGAVSHSAGQRAGRQSSLCLRLAGLGPAAPLPLLASHPCLWPFVWTPPHWLINPLLPATYLALWLGHAYQALVSISHAGEKQAPSRSWAQACMISLASLGKEALARVRHRGYLCSLRKGFRMNPRAVCAGLPTSRSHQRWGVFTMRGLCMSGNNEKPKL